MEEQRIDIKDLLNYSAIFGLSLVAVNLPFDLLQVFDSYYALAIYFLALIVGLGVSIKIIRDKVFGGYLSYGKLIRLGILLTFFAGIIHAFYVYIHLSYFGEDILNHSIQNTQQAYIEKGYTAVQAEVKSIELRTEVFTPSVFAITNLMYNVFLGFFISLILGIFLKGKNYPNPTNHE